MTITQKLALEFILIVILTAIIGILAITRIDSVASKVEIYHMQHTPINSCITHIRINLEEIVRASEEYDAGWMTEEERAEKIGEKKMEIEKDLEYLFMGTPTEALFSPETIAKLRNSIEEFYSISDKMLLIHDKSRAEKRSTMEQFDEESEAISRDLDNMLEEVEKASKALGDFLVKEIFASKAIIVLVFIVVILVALGGVFAISKSILNPIIKLRDAVVEIGKSNLDIPIDVDSKDEVGALAHSFRDMAKRLRHTQEQLLQSQKMEAIGRLAGGVAHDFNNHLTSIISLTELIKGDLRSDSPVMEDLDVVLASGKKAATLTRQLMAFARKQVLQPKVLILNDLITDSEKILERLIGENIHLVFIREANLGYVKVDPSQIDQVIMNLAINARDAMPQGGKLIFETLNTELSEEYAGTHPEVTAGAYVMLGVSDTGTGINKETLKKIFDPFFTTKEPGKGTGLGLSMAYGIVKQSGGHIAVYSEPGRGTSFKIYFPRIQDALGSTEVVKAHNLKPGGSETILVVEDEKGVRYVIVRTLRNYGYKLIEAESAEQALQIAKDYKEKIHLLLTDVVLPGMSGRQLAESFVSLYPDVPVLYMSGYTENAILHHGALDQGIHFLQKPLSPDLLLQKLREILDSKSQA
ncbi:ATP-binding protein [Elusimicrobiota bacterium]